MKILVFLMILGVTLAVPPEAINLRINGGTEVVPDSLPYQAFVMGSADYFCSGSLISPNYILTSASCIRTSTAAYIILGRHRLNNSDDGVMNGSGEVTVHENYNQEENLNDIALLTLVNPVTFNEHINFIPLANADSGAYDGQMGVLGGWGKVNTVGVPDNVLMKVDVLVLRNSQCIINYGSRIKDSMVCTDGAGSRGASDGDNGAPLVVDGVQIGIVTFYDAEGLPTVYTRVSKFRDWIAEHSDVKL